MKEIKLSLKDAVDILKKECPKFNTTIRKGKRACDGHEYEAIVIYYGDTNNPHNQIDSYRGAVKNGDKIYFIDACGNKEPLQCLKKVYDRYTK